VGGTLTTISLCEKISLSSQHAQIAVLVAVFKMSSHSSMALDPASESPPSPLLSSDESDESDESGGSGRKPIHLFGMKCEN